MGDDIGGVEASGAAVLYLDRASGEVYELNDPARALLGLGDVGLAGQSWWSVLGVASSGTPLAYAIESGCRVALPPLLLQPPQADELVAGGYLFCRQHQGREVTVLLLFPVAGGEQLPLPISPGAGIAPEVGPSDVLAVVGVDQPGGEGQWRGADIARCMIDVRRGLLQIVPAGARVGLPSGATIAVVLRAVTIEEAQDISRALLSHLSPMFSAGDKPGTGIRICIGLAQCQVGQSHLSVIMAANNALLRLQRANSGELIAVTDDPDELALMVQATYTDGIFSEFRSSPQALAYLGDLVALGIDPRHPGDYLGRVVGLTLRQQDVTVAAVYRRRHDDSYEYLLGGLAADEAVSMIAESQLPKGIKGQAKKLDTQQLREQDSIRHGAPGIAVFPLKLDASVLGCLVLQYKKDSKGLQPDFVPDASALHFLAGELSTLPDWRQARDNFTVPTRAPVQPIDYQLEGYVDDNLEGAIDQAVFLSHVDMPVAVIGPRGTGKLYVAKVIHQESGAAPDKLVAIDCREFRSRKEALNRIARELEKSSGKTLVFKSPHLMNADAQLKLARQISTRILADTSPPRYLPEARFVALFPDSLEHLVAHGGLNEKLASVFAGYPIIVPPIRDRKRAVLRWAHKILAQESARRDRQVIGFTPDAEQAMLSYDWPGNISEMRQTIASALDKTVKEWITPVDLAMFRGLSPTPAAGPPDKRPFLQALIDDVPEEPAYAPTGLDELGVALGEALHSLLELESLKPLGAWLDDEVVLAVCERFRGNMPGAAQFLHTRARNISRWMPKILSRDHERSGSSLWQGPRRLIKQWIKESAPMDEPPQQLVQALLLSHVVRQCDAMGVADRARIMGVSTPTYQKRLQEMLDQ